MDKKLLLVFYVGESYYSNTDSFIKINDTIREHIKFLNKGDNDIVCFVLPNGSLHADTVKVECINPKIVDETTYFLIKEKLEKIELDIKQKI